MLVASEWTPELALHISSRMDAPGGAQTELRSSPKKVVLISTGCRKPSVSALAWTPPGGAQTTRGIPPFVALHRRISVGAICALASLLFRDYLEMLVAPERTLELRRSPKKSTGQGVLKSWQLALHISSGLDPLPPWKCTHHHFSWLYTEECRRTPWQRLQEGRHSHCSVLLFQGYFILFWLQEASVKLHGPNPLGMRQVMSMAGHEMLDKQVCVCVHSIAPNSFLRGQIGKLTISFIYFRS